MAPHDAFHALCSAADVRGVRVLVSVIPMPPGQPLVRIEVWSEDRSVKLDQAAPVAVGHHIDIQAQWLLERLIEHTSEGEAA